MVVGVLDKGRAQVALTTSYYNPGPAEDVGFYQSGLSSFFCVNVLVLKVEEFIDCRFFFIFFGLIFNLKLCEELIIFK